MNGLFLLFALLLCVAALAFVVFPLLRDSRQDDVQSRRAVNLAVHGDRVREIEQDLVAGTLTQRQYNASLADLERELLDSGAIEPGCTAADAAADKSGRPRRTSGIVAFASIAVLPFMAVGIYLGVGHAEEVFATQPLRGETSAAAQSSPSDSDVRREFEHLVQQLQGRLAQQPDDVESWGLLGRTLVFLDAPDAAERAFREAMAHGGERDPDILTSYADLLAERRDSLTGEPQLLIEKALAIDPDHVQGLWLAGSQAYGEGEMDRARDYWERLLAVLPEDSPEAEVIRDNLTQVAQAVAEG